VHRAGGLAALRTTQTTGCGVLYSALPAAARPITEDTGWGPALVTGTYTAMACAMAAATGTAAVLAAIAVRRTLELHLRVR
jgi:hypothetical protein